MLPLNVFKKCIWLLIALHSALSNPIQSDDDGYFIETRLNNYRKRFAMLAKRVDGKYSANLQALIANFDATFESHNLKNEELLLENYIAQLDPDFAAYLQYQLDAQHMNQEINMQKWFLEQLIQQVDKPELAADIKSVLPLFEKALQAKQIDEKFEYFASVDSETPQRLLDFLQADPVAPAVLNTQLQYFREFLLYLLQENTVASFESDMKSFLEDVEAALNSNAAYEKKVELIDRFDHADTKLERFLDAKAYEFELYKFGLE